MTEQQSLGTIAGHDVAVTVTGPEAQDLDDERLGSDVLMTRIESCLADLKAEVEHGDT